MSSVMTNLGLRSRKLDPLNHDGGSPQLSDAIITSPPINEGRIASAHQLPPISRQSRASEGDLAEVLLGGDDAQLVSPARRSRKAQLLLSGRPGMSGEHDGGRSLVQASLVLDQKEREMVLARDNKRDYGRVLLELWLNQVLDPTGTVASGSLGANAQPGVPVGLNDPLKLDEGALKGLASHGLTRVELLGAGLANDAIDRLYRCMYVYTIGFFDVMQDLLGHCEFRTEVLSNVWRGFLGIAESALQVQFKSDYLKLYQSQQVAMAELLFAKEQLAEARQDSVNTEKAIGWLTAAHAEERAQRQSLKLTLSEVQAALDRERVAHQSAVAKFVAEVEERAKLLRQMELLDEKMQLAAAAQADLVAQRDAMRALYNQQQESVKHLFEDIRETVEALHLDELLLLPWELTESLKHIEPETPEAAVTYARVLQYYAEQLYGRWRTEVEKLESTSSSLFDTRDQLRQTRLHEKHLETELARALSNAALLQKLKDQSDKEVEEANVRISELDLDLAEARGMQQKSDMEIASLRHELTDTRAQLARTQLERTDLAVSLRHSEEDGRAKDTRIQELEAYCTELTATRKAVSEILVETAKAHSACRTCLVQTRAKLSEQVKRASDLQWSLFRSERQARVLEGKLERSVADVASLTQQGEEDREARRMAEAQAMGLQLDIENKKAFIETLQRLIDKHEADLNAAKDEVERVNRRADECEEQLELAREEAQKLFSSLQAMELQLEVMAEERGKLRQRIETMANERAEADKLAKQRQDMLQMELNTRTSEAAQLKQQTHLLSAQLDSSKKDNSEQLDLLERKRRKKQKWKAAAGQFEQQTISLKESLDEREAALATLDRRVDPLEVDVAILMADRGRVLPQDDGAESSEERDEQQAPGDMSDTYRAWDEALRQCQVTQGRLEAQNKALEAAREEHERARIAFYRSPTDEGLKTAMLGIEAVRAKLRAERSETEAALDEIKQGMTRLQATIRLFENAAFNRRLRAVRRRTNRLDLSMQSELSRRIDELSQRSRQLQERVLGGEEAVSRLNQKVARQDQDLARQEEEMRDLADRLRRTLEVKVEIEKQLSQYRNMNTYLQAEVVTITRERDGLKGSLQDSETQLAAANAELADASNNLSHTVRRVEARWLEEKDAMQDAAMNQKLVLEGEVADQQARVKDLTRALDRVEAALKDLIGFSLNDFETRPSPIFMWHFKPPKELVAAEGVMRQAPPRLTNFDLNGDPLLQFLMPSFSTVLVVISQLYVDKMLMDGQGEENLLGGVMGPRAPLEAVIYDFFLSRFGCRPAAELHLAAFLLGVDKYRSQHPKIRVFARLLGFPELTPLTPTDHDIGPPDIFREHPLPPPAVEFYLACLNRVHARSGPLINEAAEGFSLVKCKVIAKIAREMLRGAFTTLTDDVAGTPEYIKHMALNDEEKSIDLELSLELLLQAFCRQYWEDYQALTSMYRSTFDNVGRKMIAPDDLAVFVRQLDPDKASALPPMKLLGIFSNAMRQSGPRNSRLGACMCRALIDLGFVGIGSHLTRLEMVKSLPPYDEFRLLEESWQQMRAAVDHQTQVIRTRQESIRCDVPSYLDLARRLEELIASRENAGAAWSTYRRLLTIFCAVKPQVDEIKPFEPPQYTGAEGETLGFMSRPDTHDSAGPRTRQARLAPDLDLNDSGTLSEFKAVGGDLDFMAGDACSSSENSRSASPLINQRSSRITPGRSMSGRINRQLSGVSGSNTLSRIVVGPGLNNKEGAEAGQQQTGRRGGGLLAPKSSRAVEMSPPLVAPGGGAGKVGGGGGIAAASTAAKAATGVAFQSSFE